MPVCVPNGFSRVCHGELGATSVLWLGVCMLSSHYGADWQIPIDFVSTHEVQARIPSQRFVLTGRAQYPTDPAVVGGNMVPVMAKALQQVQSFNASIPLYYSEFNDGLFSNPPMHDYPFAASYIVKVVISPSCCARH